MRRAPDVRDEWLETDGRGGFASGTTAGIRTRRYHALLLTATTPPTGRVVLVNGLDAWIETEGGRHALSSQEYEPDVIHPDGADRLVAFTDDPVENLKQLIWPAVAQAYYISAPITRLTRSQMLEVIRQDYVRTARAKGLAERAVVYRHALRNSLLPVVTFAGWWGGRLLGGLVIMEIIFVVPGMGTALVQAVSQRDYPTVQAMVFVMALVFLVVNLFVDLLYVWLDPRIHYA